MRIKKTKNKIPKPFLFAPTVILTALLTLFLFALLPASLSKADTPEKSDVTSYNACGNMNGNLSVDPTGKNEGFSTVLYNNVNGLPTSEANAIAETSEGFIWIGSYAGLIRYDGNTFERTDSTTGISNVRCLYADSRDRLWIGTNDSGIFVMEKGAFQNWGKADGMESVSIRNVAEDSAGYIYIGSTKGVYVVEENMAFYSLDDARINDTTIQELRRGNNGTVYGLTSSGDIFILSEGQIAQFYSHEYFPEFDINAIFSDPVNPGMYYIGTKTSEVYHGSLDNNFALAGKADTTPLTSIERFEYIGGKIWICSGTGIGNMDEDGVHVLENVPMNNSVGHVMTDYEGNLWFTSTRQGVMKVVRNQFSDFFEQCGLEEVVVNTTCMYNDQLFIGSDNGLIVVKNGKKQEYLPIINAFTASGEELDKDELAKSLSGNRIRSIIRDSKNRMWISSWRNDGLVRYDKGQVMTFNAADGLFSEHVRVVSECENGNMLVANSGGVSVISGDKVIAGYGPEDGIENDSILTLLEGYNHDYIFGSDGGGIYIIPAETTAGRTDVPVVRNLTTADGLSSDIILRIKKSLGGEFYWIVTSNSLAYMTPDYQIVTIRNFPYPNNYDLYENSNGEVWILASSGIYVASKEELLRNETIEPRFYDIPNGLPYVATANSYSELTEDGDLYVASSAGVVKVNIENAFWDVSDFKMSVPFVDADGVRIYPDEKGAFTIPAETGKLTVYGYVFNYSLVNPQLSYQLQGLEKEETNLLRSELLPIDYTNLHGKTYHFRMQLKDSWGRSRKEISVKIVKEKAFYEQPWFFVAVGLLGLLLLYLLGKSLLHRKMRAVEKKHMEERVRFEQTAEALAGAIDAKDSYTNGHSRRVAEYSRKIAIEAGKSEEEIDRIYFAALLHDVGKIGVPVEILSKKGRLTEEEFEIIKQHPGIGGQILSSIKQSPWLTIGARYHHERYNGSGYPEGLAGEDIPEIARIIAVADAYDAMTSNRSYRNAIPQHIVREEIVKGMGTQFDPKFAKIMIHLIDLDREYRMKEVMSGINLTSESGVRCDSMYHGCTEGINIVNRTASIRFCSQPDDGVDFKKSLPTLIIFDSLDGIVHPGEEENENLLYFEYAKIRMDGVIEEGNIRKSQIKEIDVKPEIASLDFADPKNMQRYEVQAFRYKDQAKIRILTEEKSWEVILALPDSSRFLYISIGGENCEIHSLRAEVFGGDMGPDDIERIAEEVSFIRGYPEGDVPNVQIDGWCLDATEGILLKDEVKLSFHTMSLPTARMVWHCPFISLFSAHGGKVKGEDFHEYLLLRLDGENWESDSHVENRIAVTQKPEFAGWNDWKIKNKEGFDCVVTISRKGNKITMHTENLGIVINSETEIRDSIKDVYIALTGDQCAITNIRVERGAKE